MLMVLILPVDNSLDRSIKGRKGVIPTLVNEVLETIDLTPLQHLLVGNPGMDGLRLEQRKRLSIAVELAANPR